MALIRNLFMIAVFLGVSAACLFAGLDENAKLKIRLAGVLGDNAVIEDLDAGGQKVYRIGDTVKGYAVVAITENKVQLQNEKDASDVVVLSLGKDNTPVIVKDPKPQPEPEPLPDEQNKVVIAGTVLGRDGAPAGGARIMARDVRGKELEAETSAAGRFQLKFENAIESLSAWVGGVWIKKAGPWSSVDIVDIDLRSEPLFTIKGSVTERGGEGVGGALVYASCDRSGTHEFYAMCDPRGQYTLTVNCPLRAVWLGLSGATVKREGEWDEDAELSFDLDKEGCYSIRGTVTDASGKALSSRMVNAMDAEGRLLTSAMTDLDGDYVLRVTQPVSAVVCDVDGREIVRKGLWNTHSMLDLQSAEAKAPVAPDGAKEIEPFVMQGIAVDDKAKFLSGVRVEFFNAERLVAQTRADEHGFYRAELRHEVTHVLFQPVGVRVNGPWSSDAMVNLDLSKQAVDEISGLLDADGSFVLQGVLLDSDGLPIAEVTLSAIDEKGEVIAHADTDHDGVFKLKVTKTVASLRAFVYGRSHTKLGPWSKASKIEFKAIK